MEQPLYVLCASFHLCIRAAKEGIALAKSGQIVHFLQTTIANQDTRISVGSAGFYNSQDQYQQKIAGLWHFPLIHCHNEPNWIITEAKSAAQGRKVIFDVHDMMSCRAGMAMPESERLAFDMADGYVFPSEGYRDYAIETHKIPDEKPRVVIYSMCNDDWLKLPPLPPAKGLVMQGMFTAEFDINGEDAGLSTYSYRDHRRLCSELVKEHKIPISLYGVPREHHVQYWHTGALVYDMVPYGLMLMQLQRYEWGVVGGIETSRQRSWGMPNKLFEYITAGIPVITLNATEAGRFVTKHELGVAVTSVRDLAMVYRDQKLQQELKQNVLNKRSQFTAEREVLKLIPFYRKLMEGVSPDVNPIHIQMEARATVHDS